MVDQVVWTAGGREALAREQRRNIFLYRDRAIEELAADIAGVVGRLRPMWQRGLDSASADARALTMAADAGLDTGALFEGPTAEEAAHALLLLGAHGDRSAPFVEFLLRCGVDFLLETMAAAIETAALGRRSLSSVSAIHATEDDLAVWLEPVSPFGEGVCWELGGGALRAAHYLAHVLAGGDAELAAEARAFVEMRWNHVTNATRALYAIALDDAALANEATRDVLAERPRSASVQLAELAYIVDDSALARRAFARTYARPDHRVIARLGGNAVGVFAAELAKGHDATGALTCLSNLRGPRVARLFAPYAETRPYAVLVHNYFADAPDQLRRLRRVSAVDPHRAKLAALEARLGIA